MPGIGAIARPNSRAALARPSAPPLAPSLPRGFLPAFPAVPSLNRFADEAGSNYSRNRESTAVTYRQRTLDRSARLSLDLFAGNAREAARQVGS